MLYRFLSTYAFLLTLCISSGATLFAQDTRPPRVFLDKPLRIVQYQLGRLNNERLLMVERNANDKKYGPVYSEILSRPGLSRQDRAESASALAKINASDAATELFSAISNLNASEPEESGVAKQLAAMLLSLSKDDLLGKRSELAEATRSESSLRASVGFAGLILIDGLDADWKIDPDDAQTATCYLASIELVPGAITRNSQRDRVVSLLDDGHPANVRRAAIGALSHIDAEQADTFGLVAATIAFDPLRDAAVRTLLKIPKKHRDRDTSANVIETLITLAEKTPAEDRTRKEFLNAMELTDQLASVLPRDQARAVRDRMSEIAVRVVQVHTVEEEMRYDVPYFAVEAGREVQVILVNEDLMPHNLVITTPGDLKEVAELGSAMSADVGPSGKQYVPVSDKVLFATRMVQAGRQEALTFTAPNTPGEYPYVCTFPRHWMRMYGVMVVVKDLESWLENPVKPKDPIGSNRVFVKNWTVDDFADRLDTGVRGRTPKIGRKIFEEATCAQCHKVKGVGGGVGPELSDVFSRWKGDRAGILREILDPSHKIDPKYVVNVVLTLDGKAVSGILVADEKDSISILDNPEAKKPTVIQKDDIDIINKSSQSMMPKALMDRFTEDEIFELMHYLESIEPAP